MSTPRAQGKPVPPWAPAYVPWACLALMGAVLAWVHSRMYYTPAPLPATSNVKLFSEGRARVPLDYLAGYLGDRQVSMPGLRLATEYMISQAEVLKSMAAQRHDVTVEVVVAPVSGAVGMTFTQINFTNAYRALDTVALVLTPRGTEHLKALLIASHYDSAVCSQGASDDMAQASVMLEVARTLLAGPKLPDTPVVFLWTGGEEPISQAAHGWSTQSPLYPRLGAFINLEAMGGGGVPIVFQHTGSWVLEAWARGCLLPRGSRVAQDIFDLHIIPADSDFRMFSARHYGSLPGLDIAFLLDCTAYHSYLDSPRRLRTGVIQEMGESVLAGLASVSRELAARHTSQRVTPDQDKVEAKERSVYFDVLGYFMVVYSDDLADKLHNVPALILLAMPLLTYPPARPVIRYLTQRAYVEMGLGALCALASVILGVAAPIGLGVARALISGQPMVWFANHWAGHIQFLPIAVAAALLPWMGLRRRLLKSAPLSPGGMMAAQVQGSALTASLVGSALTFAGMRGNAMIFVMNGALGLVVSVVVATNPLGPDTLAMVFFLATFPMAVGGAVVVVFLNVMMERMAVSGAVHPVLGDVVVGALSGAGVLAITCGVFLPLLGCSIRVKRRALLGFLTAASIAAATWTSLTQPAYLPHAPKRTVISHIIQTTMAPQQHGAEGAAGLGAGTGPGGGGGVAMVVVGEAVSISGVDSTPLEQVINMSHFTLVPTVGREFLPLFPLGSMLKGITVAVPNDTMPLIDRSQRYCTPPEGPCDPGLSEPSLPDAPLVKQLPFIQLTGVEEVKADSCGKGARACAAAKAAGGAAGGRRVRLALRLFSALPCWGILNVTAPGLVGWSFTKLLSPSSICPTCGDAKQHGIRFTTQDQDPYWPFWLDIQLQDNINTTLYGVQGQVQGSTTLSKVAKGSDHAPVVSKVAKGEQGDLLTTPASRLQSTLPVEDTGVGPNEDTDSASIGNDGKGATTGGEASGGGDASGSGSSASGGSASFGNGILSSLLGQPVRIELSVSYLHRTHALRRVLALLPDHTAETWLATAYQSYWEL